MGTEGARNAEDGRSEEEWLQDLIDIFSDAYGWSKNQILNEIYPEEVPMYMQRIAERRRNANLEKISNYRMLLDIATAPHTEKGAGIKHVINQLEELEKDLKNPERVKSRISTRVKLEELLLGQIASFEEG